ncbi:SitI3 family protein [Saccharopolyspora oryzae]|uniref:SitI3 family protein n=1 Tax=Saccharopolyspora oryzae TaxID=2997343 RepID=A0ABT4UYK5_9PSEU|nr:SitI3 family protein [Saccharopolyspora oryzae]MDA3626805.1 SitI3 family protein [Saccharopolyspora oryzae]
MAVSYNLDMATPTPVATVAGELHDFARAIGLFDAPVTPEQLLIEGAVSRLGTWIRVVEARPRPQNAVSSDLGFTPAVTVVFRLDKDGEVSDQQDDMIRLVSGLLDRIPGDAVLHSDFDEIWLLRRGDDLSLSEQADLWPPHRLAAVSQRYRHATHTFSEE